MTFSKYIPSEFDVWDATAMPAYTPMSLPDVVEDLVGNSELLSRFRLMEGVKSSASIVQLVGEVEFQKLVGCNGTPSGGVEFTPDKIEVEPIYTGIKFCNEDLVGKETEVLLAAGLKRQNSQLPLEDVLMTYLTKLTREKMQTIIVNGDTSSSDSELALLDGLRKQMRGADVNVFTSTESQIDKTNAWQIISDMYEQIPYELFDNGKKVTFVVGRDVAINVIRSFNQANPYNVIAMPTATGSFSYYVPLFDIEIVSVPELTGTQEVYALPMDYVFMATDLEEDFELELKHDALKDELIVETKFRLGLKIIKPELSTRLELAGTPS